MSCFKVLLIGSAFCAAAGFCLTDTASACSNGMEYRLKMEVRGISDSERLLNADKPLRAAKRLTTTYSKPKRLFVGRSKGVDQVLRIFSTALVRLDGNYDGNGFLAATLAERDANLKWATRTLVNLSQRRPHSPTVLTALGEAYTKQQETAARGLEVLEKLEHEDRITSARGYAALAQLRRKVWSAYPAYLQAPLTTMARGPRAVAVRRCQQMSRGASYCGETNTQG